MQPGEYAVLLCDGSEITFSLPKEGCRLTLLRGEETADTLTLPALQKGEVWTRENGVSMQPPRLRQYRRGRRAVVSIHPARADPQRGRILQ